jgi:predicted nuclease of predicted toxin-antitoxin system
MTFWLDENLDPDLCTWMSSRYDVSVKHVRELGLQGASDSELFDAAKRLQITVIVSKDSDFVDLVTLRGAPPQILRLTCGNLTTPSLQNILTIHFPEALRLLNEGAPWVEIG